jgi:flagellar hook assembly protein FlgD
VLAAGVWTLTAADKPAAQPETLGVKDASGKERLKLGILKGGPAITFTDEGGRTRSTLSLDKDGLTLRYYSNSGKFESAASLQPGGLAIVAVSTDDRPQIGLNAIKQVPGDALTPDVRRP